MGPAKRAGMDLDWIMSKAIENHGFERLSADWALAYREGMRAALAGCCRIMWRNMREPDAWYLGFDSVVVNRIAEEELSKNRGLTPVG